MNLLQSELVMLCSLATKSCHRYVELCTHSHIARCENLHSIVFQWLTVHANHFSGIGRALKCEKLRTDVLVRKSFNR